MVFVWTSGCSDAGRLIGSVLLTTNVRRHGSYWVKENRSCGSVSEIATPQALAKGRGVIYGNP